MMQPHAPKSASNPVASLLYHDVLADGRDDSGFAGGGAAIYKLDNARFREHLAALEAAGFDARWPVDRLPPANASLMLTFDDGGVSAHSRTADLLERHGWIGHFFVTAGLIGTPGFLDAHQIRDLDRRGHSIGVHSWSHPPRISALAPPQILEEWRRAVDHLEEILARPVAIGSVPGGYTSRTVLTTAARAGIRFLFTSEPVSRVQLLDQCQIFGRFAVMRSTPASLAVSLAAGSGWVRGRQWLAWNTRKAAKLTAGPMYDRVRQALLERPFP
jgi:peptidoglycan/xylan/chitin deacetylase (PgdA/CDA1 family)